MHGLASGRERVFIGRGAELAAVAACVTEARSGRSTVVWVEGAAGSGKSALVERVVVSLDDDVRVMRLEAEQAAAEVPFAMLGQVGEHGADGAFATGVRLLEVFARSSTSGPSLVVVEDLHWADALTRQALLTAARRMDGEGLVMLVTCRRGELLDEGWLRLAVDDGRCTRIVLDALSVAEVGELAERCGVSLTREGVRRLHDHTIGHALYVRTVLDELAAAGTVDPGLGLPVPRTLALTTLARLAGLTAEARALACALAVLNQRAPLALAGRVAGLAEPLVALEQLLSRDLVGWWPGQPERPIEFAHPLYRQAVYEDLAPTRRQALHRLAAEVVDGVARLSHRVAAADGFDDDLAGEVAAAGLGEHRAGSPAGGAKLLMWASALSSDLGRRDERFLRAAAMMLIDGQTSQVAALRDRITGCPASAVRNLVLGSLAWQQGDSGTAIGWLTEATLASDDAGRDADDIAAALALLGIIYSFHGRSEDALDAGERLLALGPVDPVVERDGWTAVAVATASLRGPMAGLERLAVRLPADIATVSDQDADLLTIRGLLGCYAGQIAGPLADVRAAVLLAAGSGGTRVHLHLSQLLFRAGRSDEALAQGRVALSLADDLRQVWMQAQIHATVAQILAVRGEVEAANAHSVAAHAVTSALPTPEAVQLTQISDAMCAFAAFQPARVVDTLLPVSGLQREPGASRLTPIEWWWPKLIIALLDQDRIDDATSELESFTAAAEHCQLDLVGTLAEMGARIALTRGDLESSVAGFRAALDATQERSVLDRALLHHGFAEALLAGSDRKQALDQLRTAHDLFAETSAEPFRQRLQTALQAAGIKPGRSPRRSVLALTDRERDVAALVATGMTNREVAASLYVSDKAVEYHLRHIFDKLGIRSRRELRSSGGALTPPEGGRP